MRIPTIIVFILTALTARCGLMCNTDTIPATDNSNWWLQRIKAKNFDIRDTTIVYPKFARFCVDVYDWADNTFNSVNQEFISGTGKRWKVRLINDNWVDSYAMNINGNLPLHMRNDIYSNIGVSLQYMAVSIGYSVNLNTLGNEKKSGRKRFDFDFNCARFDISLYYTKNTDGTYIHKLSN